MPNQSSSSPAEQPNPPHNPAEGPADINADQARVDRLVEAAPDLLSALKGMVEAYREDDVPDDMQPSMVRAALAAIKKAEG